MKRSLIYAWDWLVVSSADPTKVSLAIKGYATLAVSFILPALALLGHTVDNQQVNDAIEAITMVVSAFLFLVGSIVAAVGTVRKLYRSFTGKHLGVQRFN